MKILADFQICISVRSSFGFSNNPINIAIDLIMDGSILMKNHIIKSSEWLYLLNWIGVLILPFFAKTGP